MFNEINQQMIDETKSGEDFKRNDILHSLMNVLESNKPEIQKFFSLIQSY